MIEINLVPENLRKKRRVQATAAAAPEPEGGLPKETIFAILGGFTIFLIILLLVFQGYLAFQISKRNKLNQQLASIEQERLNIEKIIKEMKDLKDRVRTLEKVVGTHTVIWSEKLAEISDNLPRGVWLTNVELDAKSLNIEGSAVSKLKTEIADIHALTGKLKSDKVFMSNLKNLELDMIKARTFETLSVADFKIKAELAK